PDMTDLKAATPDAARRLTERIKESVASTWELIEEAYLTRAWAALGYESWDAYCSAEFGTSRIPLPREERREVVTSLREAGLSTRAIAAATGVPRETVRRDLSVGDPVPKENGSPAVPMVTGIDGKAYAPSPRPRVPEPGIWDASPPEPEPRPAPKPAPVMLTLRTHKGDPVPYPK